VVPGRGLRVLDVHAHGFERLGPWGFLGSINR
jgi:hypothetical protein